MRALHLYVMVCVVGLCACQDVGDLPGEARVFEALESIEAPPDAEFVVDFGEGQGGVTRQDMELLWAHHPEWSREQVLEAAIRQALVWRARDASHDELVREHWRELDFARKRGAVQAWLDREVLNTPEQSFADDAVQFDVNNQLKKMVRPAGYRASHLLVRVPEGADEATVERARAATAQLGEEFRAAGEVFAGDLIARLARLEDEQIQGFGVLVNANMKFPMQPLPKEGMPEGWVNMMPEFLTGALELAASRGLGKLSEPVRSRLGWHLIVVHERMPRLEPEREEVEAIVRSKQRELQHQKLLFERLEPLYSSYTWSSDPGALEDDLTGSAPQQNGEAQ